MVHRWRLQRCLARNYHYPFHFARQVAQRTCAATRTGRGCGGEGTRSVTLGGPIRSGRADDAPRTVRASHTHIQGEAGRQPHAPGAQRRHHACGTRPPQRRRREGTRQAQGGPDNQAPVRRLTGQYRSTWHTFYALRMECRHLGGAREGRAPARPQGRVATCCDRIGRVTRPA